MKRFWEKVQIAGPDECWEWKGGKDREGYGRFSYFGKNQVAHRIAWILTGGEVSEGLCVLHKCDNPSCVNPDHLWIGNQLENIKDRTKKGRDADCRGEKNPSAKLAEEDVLEIRRRLVCGEIQNQIAKIFGVAASTITDIKTKRTWAHICPP